jgi:hypothetical protein
MDKRQQVPILLLDQLWQLNIGYKPPQQLPINITRRQLQALAR